MLLSLRLAENGLAAVGKSPALDWVQWGPIGFSATGKSCIEEAKHGRITMLALLGLCTQMAVGRSLSLPPSLDLNQGPGAGLAADLRVRWLLRSDQHHQR